MMDKRSGVEEEMNVIIQRLCQPGGPGLSGNLVDSEADLISFYCLLVRKKKRQNLSLHHFIE